MDSTEANHQAATIADPSPSHNETQGATSSNPAPARINSIAPASSSSSTSPFGQGSSSTTFDQSTLAVSNNAPGFKYKYPEAAPTPPGEDDAYWNKIYTAADSRMYNKHGKDANNSRKYRQSGETRALAFVMLEEKKAKEAAGILPRAPPKPRVSQVSQVSQVSPMKKSSGMDSSGSRDATPSHENLSMSISEKIKAEGRARKTSSAAPISNRGTPVPTTIPVAKPFKKRGTAAPVKRPPHKKQRLDNNAGTPTSSARASQTPGPTAPDPQSGDESDTSTRSGTLYCICRKPDDHSLMIECAGCEGWFHPRCMKIADEDVRDLLVDRFVCNDCTTPEFRTNFKRICRLYNINKGCRRPARVSDKPPHQPSKYCSEEHKEEFWAHVWDMIRKDDKPSMGGALNRGEVAALLMACPNAEAFNKLGSKPKLPDIDRDPKHPLGLKFLTPKEEEVVTMTNKLKACYQGRIIQLQNQVKLLNMVHERAKRATQHLGKDNKTAICGYDARLAFNPDQFEAWFNSDEGKLAYETNTLGPRTPETQSISKQIPTASSIPQVNGDIPDVLKDMCLVPARKCKHFGWREMHNQEFTDHKSSYKHKISNLEVDLVELIEDAETREATKAFHAENRARHAY